MGGHAERTTKLHQRVLLNLGYSKSFVEQAVPNNEPIDLIAESLFKAWWDISSTLFWILLF